METSDLVATDALASSVLELAQALIRIPSQGGIDDYGPIIEHLAGWLAGHGLEPRQLRDAGGRQVGVWSEVKGGRPGPRIVLDATIDTAPFGDLSTWAADPTSGHVVDGWLHGRGASDSKAGVSIFCHVGAQLARSADRLAGSVVLLFDGDEHAGTFTGATTFFEEADGTVDAVMIGYPGLHRIVIGGRGFQRFRVAIRGEAAHAGSSRPAAANAVTRAAQLVAALEELNDDLSARVESDFGVPPKLTVTGVRGGESFSIVPDLCTVDVDVRLTPGFTADAARDLVHDAVAKLDHDQPGHPSRVEEIRGWPPFRTSPDTPVVRALRRAAERALGSQIPLEVVGPSNIGNYVAGFGIPTIAGFGPAYRNLHAANEAIEVATCAPVFEAYGNAVLDLLGAAPG